MNKWSLKYAFLIMLFAGSLLISCRQVIAVEETNTDLIIELKVDSILALMTLDEKIGQMSQVRHFDLEEKEFASRLIGSVIHTEGPLPGENASDWQAKFTALQKQALSTRLGIPLLFAVDAVHGQNTYEGATIFPHNIGLGASGNARLVEEAAAITAIETQATGINWVFSPCVAIPYNDKWGRVYEAFSESTDLTNELAKASVRGHQGNLSDQSTVLATAKHFIGDGATDNGIEGGETSLGVDEIVDRLLPPYRAAVEAGVGSIMASFNTMSGQAMHAHRALITDTLKIGMGFDGIVVSDWKGYSKFGEADVVKAGIDICMAVDGDLDDFQTGLKGEVESGNVAQARIDDAVRRILRQKFRLGLFENPFPDANLITKIGSQKHRDVARQGVRESLVLLKNENNALPLDKEISKIVVVGEFADNAGLQSGGWTINWQGTTENYSGATTILEGIKEIYQGDIIYDKNGTGDHTDADAVIVVVGESPYAEFFGDIGHEASVQSHNLSEAHKNYIDAYANTGKLITILISGRPMVVTEQIGHSDAFVAAWLPGSEGDGIAEVLFGDYDFKGKLPHSWPKSISDYNNKYGPNFWDESITPLFPFGYGLQYKQG
ncbi:MAG: glycoside hydrolase family 3 C-terminal domain-containing protein [Bacteroidia bacterium]|nr:glycoside hydrolase family 3 C-terminal domain-containing protein [Bacteroidia bacterium]